MTCNCGSAAFLLAIAATSQTSLSASALAGDGYSQIVYQTNTPDSGSSVQLKGSSTEHGKGDLDSNFTVITPGSDSVRPFETSPTGDRLLSSAERFDAACGGKTGMDPQSARALVDRIAAERGEDTRLAAGLVQQESAFLQDQVSAKGAIGLTQLLPATAAKLGVNPCKPEENVRGGLAYLAQLRRQFGNPVFALAAYNAGPERIEQYQGVPPFKETLDYVAGILTDYYRTEEGVSSPAIVAPSDAHPTRRPKLAVARQGSQSRGTGPEWQSGFVMNLD